MATAAPFGRKTKIITHTDDEWQFWEERADNGLLLCSGRTSLDGAVTYAKTEVRLDIPVGEVWQLDVLKDADDSASPVDSPAA